MDLHKPTPSSPSSLLRGLARNQGLIWHMIKREVAGRYRYSVLGVMWVFFNPLLLLMLYTFFFSVVFNARWGGLRPESKFQFAILLYVGMIVHTLFSEAVTRAPMLIVSNVSYVKKIVFPLEILPVVALGTALFNATASFLVLLSAFLLINGQIHWTALLLPVVLSPLIVLTLGVTWSLASLGVFLRDVEQPIGVAMTVLLFASPVFYPVDALPERIRPWLMLNPLTFIIEQARAVLIFGELPNWYGLVIYTLVASTIGWVGYFWFQKTRKGFANVL
jgi:lipopolysaccharide transport system permease protein